MNMPAILTRAIPPKRASQGLHSPSTDKKLNYHATTRITHPVWESYFPIVLFQSNGLTRPLLAYYLKGLGHFLLSGSKIFPTMISLSCALRLLGFPGHQHTKLFMCSWLPRQGSNLRKWGGDRR